MIRFVFGLPGTGKTTWITEKIKEDAKSGKPSLLIVPEQQTVEVERTMLALLPASAQLTFEAVWHPSRHGYRSSRHDALSDS